MKKIVILIICIISIFSLAACKDKDNKTENNNGDKVSFETYLKSHDALTIEEFNNLFSVDGGFEIPNNFFTNLTLSNHELEMEYFDALSEEPEIEEQYKAHLWNKQNKVYLSLDYDSPFFVDLNKLEEYYDMYNTNFNEVIVGIKPSALISIFVKAMEEELGLPFGLSLTKILNFFDFDYTEFESTNDPNKFQLKQEAIVKKMIAFSEDTLTEKELNDIIRQNGIDIDLIVTFDGYNISNYLIEGTVFFEGYFINFDINIGLGFKDGKLNKINLILNSPIIQTNITFEKNNSTLNIAGEVKFAVDSETFIIDINSRISKEKIFVNISIGEQIIFGCDLNIKLLRVTNKYLLDVNGSASIFDGEYQYDVTIKSGNDVKIPSELTNKENEAYDQTDDIIEKLLHLIN